MADLQGHDFRARVELTTKAGETIADVGESCARVNPRSLPWLLEQRQIKRLDTVHGSASAASGPVSDGPAAGAGATDVSGVEPIVHHAAEPV